MLVVAGSIALDTLEGPFGRVTGELGGSALYFALAASLLGPGNAQLRRPYPTVGSIRDGAGSTPIGNSSYEGLQARFQYRMRRGMTAHAAYAFSKTLDQFQGSGSFGSQEFGSSNVQDYYNLRAEKSPALCSGI